MRRIPRNGTSTIGPAYVVTPSQELDIRADGFAFPNPMTQPGDMIIGAVAGEPARIGVGPQGQWLIVGASGLPEWTGNPMTTRGDMIIADDAGVPIRLAGASGGAVLGANPGGFGYPAWTATPKVDSVEFRDWRIGGGGSVSLVRSISGGDNLIGPGFMENSLKALTWLQGAYLEITDNLTAPTAVGTDKLALYSKHAGGVGDLYIRDSTLVERKLATTSNSLANPMTTRGDMIVADDAGVPRRLIGQSGGTVLGSNPGGFGYPDWTATPKVDHVEFRDWRIPGEAANSWVGAIAGGGTIGPGFLENDLKSLTWLKGASLEFTDGAPPPAAVGADKLAVYVKHAGGVGNLYIMDSTLIERKLSTETGGGAMTNPMLATGDLIVGGTNGIAERRALGTNGYVLTALGGTVQWSPPVAGNMGTSLNLAEVAAPATPLANTVVLYAKVDGLLYSKDDAGVETPLSGGGGSSTETGRWDWTTTVQDAGPIASGDVAANQAQPTLATAFVFSKMSALGVDTTNYWAHVYAGDHLYIQDESDSSQWVRYQLTGAPTASGGDFRVPVGSGTQSATPLQNNRRVAVTFSPGSAAGGGMTNPMTAVGDLIRGGTSGAPTRLAVGTNGHVLTLSGGVPAWAASPGFANPMTAVGDVIVGAASGAAARLGIGATNAVLNVASGTPAWTTTPTLTGVTINDPATTGFTLSAPNDAGVELVATGTNGHRYRFSSAGGSSGFPQGSFTVSDVTASNRVGLQILTDGTVVLGSAGLPVRAVGGIVQFAGTSTLATDAADTLAVRNGTTVQKFRVYETSSGADKGYLEFWAPNGGYVIRSVGEGAIPARSLMLSAGANNTLALQIAGSTKWYVDGISGTFAFLPGTSATTNIGSTGNRVRDLYTYRALTVRSTITYSASMNTDASLGEVFVITMTAGTAFTMNAPTNGVTGQILTYQFRNTHTAAIQIQTSWFNAVFKVSGFLQVTNAFSKAISFIYDGTNWVELWRSSADVPN